MNHSPDDEKRAELLGRLLSGAADGDDPEVAAELAKDATLTRDLTELQALADDLDEARGFAAAPGRLPAAEPWSGADRAMRDLVHAQLGVGVAAPVARAPARARRIGLAVLAAAAAVLVVLLLREAFVPAPPTAPRDRVLALPAGTLWPDTPVARSDLRERGFMWSFGTTRAADRYVLTIEWTEAGAAKSYRKSDLAAVHWAVPEELLATLPNEFRCSIERQRPGFEPERLAATVVLH